MRQTYAYKPATFFAITFLGTWLFGFIAAYLSYQKDMQALQFLCMLPGLFAPYIAAMIMLYGAKNKDLRTDFWCKLSFYRIKLNFMPVLLLMVPVVVILATAISLLFGEPASQFLLSSDFNIWQGQGFLSLLILFIAPMLEEFGWRGYGVDSLRSKFNLMKTTLLFASLWALWHLPLFFTKGYYQYELWHIGIIYALNFIVSILPAAILINWIYYANNRSIAAAVWFHFMLNLFSVIFQTTQFTKCIITVLLLIISSIIIMLNKKLFLEITQK
jgi:membrane protease YdiL (CAAX protease family)